MSSQDEETSQLVRVRDGNRDLIPDSPWGIPPDIIYVRTTPRGVDPASNQPFFYQGTGEFPLPQAGQPGRERDGNGLPKKRAPARVSIEWGGGGGGNGGLAGLRADKSGRGDSGRGTA
jgi:hypothetical protein